MLDLLRGTLFLFFIKGIINNLCWVFTDFLHVCGEWVEVRCTGVGHTCRSVCSDIEMAGVVFFFAWYNLPVKEIFFLIFEDPRNR